MKRTAAQVTTRTGPAGTENAPPLVHGTYDLTKRADLAAMRSKLAELMHAAGHVAKDGIVTEVAVLVYDPIAAGEVLDQLAHQD